ncbi:MAG: RNA methyltransferase [Bacteroidota bacterium]
MRKLKLEELGRLSIEAFKEEEKLPIIVVLDNIRSMHNVGAVLRSSDAFKVEKVYMCGITPSPPHREIRKTAIGAEDSVNWEKIAETPKLLEELKKEGYTILAIEQTDSSIPLSAFKTNPSGKYAVVLGHEVSGVSDEAIALSDLALEIPQFGTKHSLNISVATGIVLYKLSVEGLMVG